MTNTFKARVAVLVAALIISGSLLGAARSGADGCGDVGPGRVPPSGCADPAPTAQAPWNDPPWLAAVRQRDPQFAGSYQGMRERVLKDGAIPVKYKLLMGMITDAIAAHPDGVRSLAENARAAGASEAEITEAVEVGYLYGGTAALVMGVNAFPGN
ncbi:carboxymuconolactone decarboxylase family protein [Mycobacterium sp. pR1184]|uniref:carboxymuconolactone decarboxylase family protein n=1 Tax=Mycobacterium sp. pR1184 TaxID=3238981 RepID=UPI00351B6E74